MTLLGRHGSPVAGVHLLLASKWLEMTSNFGNYTIFIYILM